MVITAKDIVQMLRVKHDATNYDAQRWVFFEELRVGTGFRDWRTKYQFAQGDDGRWQKELSPGYHPEQRIDAWAMSVWKSDKFKSVAYEIKVSRTDYLREILRPAKRETAMQFSNQFYFVAPDGIIKPSEVPDGCGLIQVQDGKLVTSTKAPHREIGEPTWEFYAALVRAIGRKGYDAMFSELVEVAA